MSDLFREGPRLDMNDEEEWKNLLEKSRARGRAMGITSEEDVERLCEEYRREKRTTSGTL